MNKYLKIIGVAIIVVLVPFFVIATSGCCSWHDGVCGCDSSVGRQLCCDGSLSPSCGCYKKPVVYTPPVVPPKPADDKKRVYDDLNQLKEKQIKAPLLSEIDNLKLEIDNLKKENNGLTEENKSFIRSNRFFFILFGLSLLTNIALLFKRNK